MSLRNPRTALAAYCAAGFVVVLLAFQTVRADDEERQHRTGLRKPTARELEWRKNNETAIRHVQPNARALDRFNKMRKERKQRQLRIDEV